MNQTRSNPRLTKDELQEIGNGSHPPDSALVLRKLLDHIKVIERSIAKVVKKAKGRKHAIRGLNIALLRAQELNKWRHDHTVPTITFPVDTFEAERAKERALVDTLAADIEGKRLLILSMEAAIRRHLDTISELREEVKGLKEEVQGKISKLGTDKHKPHGGPR